MNKKYILIDKQSGSSEILAEGEHKLACKGLKKKKGDLTVWVGEEYLVMEVSE